MCCGFGQMHNDLCASLWSFPGGSGMKTPPANAGDTGLIPGWGRSPGGGNGNLLQYSCLENPMDRGAWWATVHRVRHDWATEHNNITQRSFTAPRPLCSIHSLTSTDFFFNCLHSFAFSRTSYSWNYTVFSDWLSSLSSNMPLGFRNTCSHDTIAHFILALADVPPSGCASAHLFTNWRTSWLLPSLGNYE